VPRTTRVRNTGARRPVVRTLPAEWAGEVQSEAIQPFTDIVSEAASDERVHVIEGGVWPTPIRSGEWFDQTGNRWHIRGSELDAKQARRLLDRSDVHVVHINGPHPTEVISTEREAPSADINHFLKWVRHPGSDRSAPPGSTFRFAEFRDAQDGVMIVVEESC
jgi:hypothetical protein